MIAILQIVAALLVPAAALYGASKVKPLEWIGPVGLCYLAGLAVAYAPAISLNRAVSMHVAEIAVPLSMPLLLFTTRLRKWLKLARPTLIGFALACVAAVASSLLYGWLFRSRLTEAAKVAGMLVGVYVGGTSNLSVIGLALKVKEETFVLLNASDVVVGGAYLLFLLTIAQRVALLFLPKFRKAEATAGESTNDEPAEKSVWRRDRMLPMSGALLASLGVAGVSAGLTWVVFGKIGDDQVPIVLLLITTIGLGCSFITKLRENEGSYELGEYILLSFCFAIGTLANVRELASANPDLLLMVAAVQFTAIALHYGLCAMFRVDADTTLITSTATIFGPAFIGPVAKSLKNRELVVGGITTALVGFAIANYLGLTTAYLLSGK
ncbi:MAG: DUF819 family protein [Myxococcaceae bacterium]